MYLDRQKKPLLQSLSLSFFFSPLLLVFSLSLSPSSSNFSPWCYILLMPTLKHLKPAMLLLLFKLLFLWLSSVSQLCVSVCMHAYLLQLLLPHNPLTHELNLFPPT